MILYHNTSNENALSIAKQGIIPGLRQHVYGKGNEAEGSGIWCTNTRGYGYGGATITFEVDENDEDLFKQNDTDYTLYRKVPVDDIIDIDLVISTIPCNVKRKSSNTTVESDIPEGIKEFGVEKIISVFDKWNHQYEEPYNTELLKQLIKTGKKYTIGTIDIPKDIKVESIESEYNKEDVIKKVKDIVNKCIDAGLQKELKSYTIPVLREYMLHNNPVADNRINPWKYLINEIETSNNISIDLIDFIDSFIREANRCYNDLVNTESNKLQESSQEDINSFIEKELDDGTSWDNQTKLKWLRDNMYKQIRLIGRKINNAKYDYERNTLKRNQDFYKEVLKELDKRLKDIKTENSKLEEASRNELLSLAKSQTITRYNKSAGYKGFSIVDIDMTSIFKTDTITVTCNVGKYYDTVEMQDILIWIQMEAERNENNQVNTKVITAALMEAIDALEIKVDCTCPDFGYRFAYQATQLDYKYGKPENRPANITNPKNYGSICKHLISMLSNKKWLQQVTGTIMDWMVKNIDQVNEWLRPKEGMELTLPNELARYNAKKGFYSKLFKDKLQDEEPDEDNNEEEQVDIPDEDLEELEPTTPNDNKNEEDNEEGQGPQKHI